MDEKTIDLKEFIKIVRKRKRLIANVFFATVLISVVVSFAIPPTYEAATTLRIKQPHGLADSLLADLPMDSPTMTQQQMATYAEILESRTVVQKVIDTTQWNTDDPPTYEDMLKLITTEPVKDTEILNVKFRDKSPAKAQYVVNKLVEVFLGRMTALARSEQTVSREFIGERLQQAKTELDSAETALEEYKRNQKIVAPDEETKSMVDSFATVKSMAADNTVALTSAQAKLASIQQQIAAQKPGFIADSPLIEQYESKLADLEVQLVGLKQNYTDQYPEVLATKAAIAETKAKLNNEVVRVVNYEAPSMNPIQQGLLQARIQAEADIAAAHAQQGAISGIMFQGDQEMSKLPAKEKGLGRLMRDVDVGNQVVAMLAQKYEEARISEFAQPTDVQVIDVAIAPDKPIFPRKALNVAIAAILGLLMGIGLAFLQEYVNKTIRTADDVKQYLELPILGSIPDYNKQQAIINNNGLWQRLKVRVGL